jgi:hypothetical protein
MRRMIVVAFLLCFIQAYAKSPVIPEALFNAKTAVIINAGAEAKDIEKLRGLLKEWGRFEIIQNKSAADITFTLSTQIENKTIQLPNIGGGLGGISTQQVPVSYLQILDAHDGSQLWSDKTIGTSKDPKQLVNKLRDRMKKK